MEQKDKNSKPLNSGSAKEKGSGEDSTGSGFLAKKFSGLFKKPEAGRMSASDFKKEKKVLSDYQSLVMSEKDKRKPPQPVRKPEKADVPPSEKKKEKLEFEIKSDVLASGPGGSAGKADVNKEPQKSEQNKEKSSTGFKLGTDSLKKKFASAKGSASQVIKTNLIKGEITTIVNWKKNIIFLLVAFVVPVIIIGLFYGGLLFWESKAEEKGEQLGGDIDTLYSRIQKTEKEVVEADEFQDRLSLVRSMLDQHIYVTNLLEFLEDNLLSNSYIITGLTVSPQDELVFSIRARRYTDIADQIRIFKASEYVKSVFVDGGSLAASENDPEVGVQFQVILKFEPKLYTK